MPPPGRISRACRRWHDCRLRGFREVQARAMGDADAAPFGFLVSAAVYKFAVALPRHPLRPGEMTAVNETGALRLPTRVNAKKETGGLPPIGAVILGVKKAQIELHVRSIIAGKPRTFRGFVEKIDLWHVQSPATV